MLYNLIIDLCANMCLTFIWEDSEEEYVTAVCLGEDPTSGAPYVDVLCTVKGLRECGITAWEQLLIGKYTTVVSAVAGLDPISSIWSRDFGSNFSRALDPFVGRSGKVSGVVLRTWADRRIGIASGT